MNETTICAVGNVATQPVFRELASGPSARFRLAVTARYLDREKNEWTDGHTNFFTVWANRQLALNVSSSLNVGDPVIVQGRLKVRSETREGQNRTSADLDAVSIGHDLSRGTSAFRRTGRPETGTGMGMGAGMGTGTGTTASAPHRPEPNWETQPGDSGSVPAQPEAVPAAVT
ncbi:single-stranded DNA-binding protein [Streptomyces sp. NBC_00485]|uniref:single-stranded DNA-binding protein n=1 Tax=Streptomyces sp. NBC_00485 TaxID=2975758 RepID=UPI002E17DF3C